MREGKGRREDGRTSCRVDGRLGSGAGGALEELLRGAVDLSGAGTGVQAVQTAAMVDVDGCERVGSLHTLIERHFGRDVAERVFFENARDFFVRNEG